METKAEVLKYIFARIQQILPVNIVEAKKIEIISLSWLKIIVALSSIFRRLKVDMLAKTPFVWVSQQK